jgi:hypothetical protein
VTKLSPSPYVVTCPPNCAPAFGTASDGPNSSGFSSSNASGTPDALKK